MVEFVDGVDVGLGGGMPECGAVDEGGESKRLAKDDEIGDRKRGAFGNVGV